MIDFRDQNEQQSWCIKVSIKAYLLSNSNIRNMYLNKGIQYYNFYFEKRKFLTISVNIYTKRNRTFGRRDCIDKEYV